MSAIDTLLAAALAASRPLFFLWAELDLPSGTLRLLDGSGEVPIGGHVFVGRDPVYGVLDSIKGLSDGSADSAPEVQLGLIPASDAAMSVLIDPAVQGSAAAIGVGVLDMGTGLPIGEPCTLYTGEIDVPTVTWDANDRRLEYRIGNIGERLFSIEEGRRLTDAFHQSRWPGELGLAFVTDIENWVPWGQALNTAAIETRTNLPSMGGQTFART